MFTVSILVLIRLSCNKKLKHSPNLMKLWILHLKLRINLEYFSTLHDFWIFKIRFLGWIPRLDWFNKNLQNSCWCLTKILLFLAQSQNFWAMQKCVIRKICLHNSFGEIEPQMMTRGWIIGTQNKNNKNGF